MNELQQKELRAVILELIKASYYGATQGYNLGEVFLENKWAGSSQDWEKARLALYTDINCHAKTLHLSTRLFKALGLKDMSEHDLYLAPDERPAKNQNCSLENFRKQQQTH